MGFKKAFSEGLDTVGFQDRWWFGRPRGDDPDTEGSGPIAGGHHPYARPFKVGWQRQAASGETWVAQSEDASRWEVICEECGDHDGPAERLSPKAREMRGPYPSEREAKRAATRHFKEVETG